MNQDYLLSFKPAHILNSTLNNFEIWVNMGVPPRHAWACPGALGTFSELPRWNYNVDPISYPNQQRKP